MEIKFNAYEIEAFEKAAYEAYKADWIASHISPERMTETFKEYTAALMEQFENSDWDACSHYTFEEFLDEQGYQGELYVCFEEFLGAEFRDYDYMTSLLGVEPYETMCKQPYCLSLEGVLEEHERLEDYSKRFAAGITFEDCDIEDVDEHFAKLYPRHDDMLQIIMRAADAEQGTPIELLSKYGFDLENGTPMEQLEAVEKMLADDVATEFYVEKHSGDVRFCILDEDYDESCNPNMRECDVILSKVEELENKKNFGNKLDRNEIEPLID
jgi:hypothetical protein